MKRVLKKDAWISRWRENKNNFSRSFEHSSSFRSRFVFFSFLKGDGRPEKKRMTDGVFHGWTRGWNLARNGGMALFNSLKLRFLRWDAVSRCVAGEFSLTKGGKRGKRGEGDNDVRHAKKFYFRLPGKTRWQALMRCNDKWIWHGN